MANGNKKHSGQNPPATDNDHQKTVQGMNQNGPGGKVGKSAGGNEGSRGQNSRPADSGGDPSIGSHKPGGDGPGTKKFKYEADDSEQKRKRG